MPVIRSREKLENKAVHSLLTNFHLSRKELVTTNYVLAFKQLTEVVLKAMSPANNDPGTALNAIDYLSDLLRLRMLKSDQSFIPDSGRNLVKMRTVSFEELLYEINASFRKYCSEDIVVVQKLAQMFIHLQRQEAIDPSFYGTLQKEAKRLLYDARTAMKNEADLETLNFLATRLHLKI